ncbi:MAG TPA: heat-inducible transcriptional repressor HrcA [Acidimicrobiales bacterium]|nr:heat-inducible transcriptional repressor HrcA [Acidimicrobiales bacterium]
MVPHRTARPPRHAPPSPRAEPTEPARPEEAELDQRKAAILTAVVSEYIETAEPVGSAHITGTPGVEVSSATVRSDMAALERDGYLTQPHTSAGRIPTDKGYRFFVDTLGSPGTLGPVQRQEVRRFFAHVHGAVEDLLGHTSGLLANLTDYAAVVVGPTHETATIRSVQLVDLGPNLALLVVVLSDGAVEKRAIEIGGEHAGAVDDVVLAAAATHMTAHLRGRTVADPGTVPDSGDAAFDAAVRLGTQALADLSTTGEPENVFVGGSSHMASAFDAVETVRSVLSILEQQLVVVELVEHILDRGLSVAIGSEHGFEPLASCALVLAPVSVDGETAGTIGVVGPTRMNYPRALASVQIVAERLGERLGGPAPGDGGDRGR